MASPLLGRAHGSIALQQRSLAPKIRPNIIIYSRQLRDQQGASNRFRQHCSAAETARPAVETVQTERDDTDNRTSNSSNRKHARKPSPGPTVVAQSAPAVAAGPLPEVLSATFPDTFPTLSAARRVIRKDLILVDGMVGSCKAAVAAGQTLQQLEAVAKHKPPRTVSLEVAVEDDSIAVVHKPWGVKMYGGDARRTITGALRAGALKPSSKTDALPEPRPVHRLDAAVGGLLVVAKTAAAVTALSAEFQGRRVHKVYHALLSGRLDLEAAAANLGRWQQQQQKQASTSDSTDLETLDDSDQADASNADDQQTLDTQQLSLLELLELQLRGQPPFSITAADIRDPCLEPPPTPAAAAAVAAPDDSSSISGDSNRANGDSSSSMLGTLSTGVHFIDFPLAGKSCYTLVQVLGYSRCPRFGGWMTSVALSPVTGRKHQLRQHMAAMGYPIVGDGKYALDKEDHIGNQGIYLESLEVWFTHPDSQELTHISMPEPQRFATLRQQQHNRWNKLQAAAAAAAAAAEGTAAAEEEEAKEEEAAADRSAQLQ